MIFDTALPNGNVRVASTHFTFGEHDAPDRLLIPEKLYGRAREVDTLLASFDRIVAERHAGVGAGFRVFRNWQILGRQ